MKKRRMGELECLSVVAFFAPTATDGKTYQVEFFNLDAVSYRDRFPAIVTICRAEEALFAPLVPPDWPRSKERRTQRRDAAATMSGQGRQDGASG
jgi:hypothetical protein